MLADRSVKLDLFALALAALCAFLAPALLTYDPADPPSAISYPPNVEIENVCGKSGAWAAFVLFEGLGLGAYYVVASLGVLAGVLLQGRRIEQRWVRAVGWTLSLVGSVTLWQVLIPQWSPGPVIGAGGYVGAIGRAWLESHFALAGSLILLLSAIVGGL